LPDIIKRNSISEIAVDVTTIIKDLLVDTPEKINIAISGGSTPAPIFKLWKNSVDGIEWSRVNIFWVDERFVPFDDANNNATNALAHIGNLGANIFRINTSASSPELAASTYETTIRKNVDKVENDIPVFDIILLGMGGDGHTASLFPETDILNESSKLVKEVFVHKLASDRVSMTYPLILAARYRVMVFGGQKKIEVFQKIQESTANLFPSSRIFKEGGDSDKWFYFE